MSALKFSNSLLRLSRKWALRPIIYRDTKWKNVDTKALFSTYYTNKILFCQKYSTDQVPRGNDGCKGTSEATYPCCKKTVIIVRYSSDTREKPPS